jgi:hypothetical protein
MFGWKPCLIALAPLAWLGTAAEAQGIVPGGWSPQFSYQTFAAPGAVGFGVIGGAYPGYGYGVSLPGYSPYGVGGAGPFRTPAPPPYNYLTPSSQAVNAVDPLIGAIRRSTRRKGSR